LFSWHAFSYAVEDALAERIELPFDSLLKGVEPLVESLLDRIEIGAGCGFSWYVTFRMILQATLDARWMVVRDFWTFMRLPDMRLPDGSGRERHTR